MNVTWCSHCGKQSGGSSKIKHRITIGSSNFSSGYAPQRVESWDSNIHLHTHNHITVIHRSQKMEATHVSIGGWTDKQNVIYSMQPGKRKETLKCYNIVEPWGHFAKLSKPVAKGQISFDSTYVMRHLELWNSETGYIEWWPPGPGGGERGISVWRARSFVRDDENVLELSGVAGSTMVWIHVMPLNCKLRNG